MAELNLYTSDEEAELARIRAAIKRTPTERFDLLMKLIKASVMMNGGKPLKKPDGKHVIELKKKL